MPTPLISTITDQSLQPVNPAPLKKTESSREPVREQSLPGGGKDVPQTEAPQEEELSNAVEQINKHVQNLRRDLEFSVDEDSNRVVIKVRDSETGEVIRQIPPEEALSIAKQLSESVGLIFKASA